MKLIINVLKKIVINNNGSYWFDLNKNKKIKNFLKNKTGWVTIQSDNPFVNGWYIEKSKVGFIGADHFFNFEMSKNKLIHGKLRINSI